MIEINKIYNEDCLETMARMDDKFVDLCLTDIPFNVNWDYGETYNDNLSDDEYSLKCEIWFNAIKRISKRAIIKIPTKFSYLVLPVFHKTLGYYWTIIQYSPNTTSHGRFNLHLYTQYLVSEGESERPGVDLFVNTKNNIITDHPAEMPTRPIKWLIEHFTKENALIYDPFLGSGTTAIASIELDRNWIGSEINPGFYEIADKRIKQELSQLKLPI